MRVETLGIMATTIGNGLAVYDGLKRIDFGHRLAKVRTCDKQVECKPNTACLRLHLLIPARKATACDLVEMPGEPLEVHEGASWF